MRCVVLQRGEDGYWVADVPSLPGCISQGRTQKQAVASIKDAIEAWVLAARSLCREVPEEKFRVGRVKGGGALLHRGEDGYWVAEVPSFPGCISQGKTQKEARESIKDAIEAWVETAKSLHEYGAAKECRVEAVYLNV